METFVVRLWTPAPAAGDPGAASLGMHGTARHVGTGRSATFRDGRELLELLEVLGQVDAPTGTDRTPPSTDVEVLPTGP
jgi:hypothetical protein